MAISFYRVKATRSVPITVNYICEYCGQPNTDDTQSLNIEGYSGLSSVRVMTDPMKDAAVDSLRMNTKRVLYDLDNRRYKKFALTCTCSHCGKRQSWSSYHKPNRLYAFLCLLGLISLPSIGIGAMIKENAWAILFLLIPPLLIAPQIYTMICNYKANQKANQTDEKFLPKIVFRDEEIARIAKEVAADKGKAGSEREYIPVYEQEWQDAARRPNEGEWKCPSCWRMNKNSVTVCDCGSEKPKS